MKSFAIFCLLATVAATSPTDVELEKADARALRGVAAEENVMAQREQEEAVEEQHDAKAIREEVKKHGWAFLEYEEGQPAKDKAALDKKKIAAEKEKQKEKDMDTDAAQIDTVAAADKKDAAITEKEVVMMENDAYALAADAGLSEKADQKKKVAMSAMQAKATPKAEETKVAPKAAEKVAPKVAEPKPVAKVAPKVEEKKAVAKVADAKVATKVVDDKTAPQASVQVVNAKAVADHPPVGEGAYQSAKAVQERTRSGDRHCEDAGLRTNEHKWNDCYHSDYVDADKPYEKKEKKEEVNTYQKKSEKSGSQSARVAGVAVISVLLAMVRQ